MCATCPTQRVAASFEQGSNARFATNANNTRSTWAGSQRRPASSVVMRSSMPNRRHNPSSTQVPPS
jgi:hypothetical protein